MFCLLWRTCNMATLLFLLFSSIFGLSSSILYVVRNQSVSSRRTLSKITSAVGFTIVFTPTVSIKITRSYSNYICSKLRLWLRPKTKVNVSLSLDRCGYSIYHVNERQNVTDTYKLIRPNTGKSYTLQGYSHLSSLN